MIDIAVAVSNAAIEAEGELLAKELHLPFTTEFETYDYLLLLTPEHLGIKKSTDKSSTYVDFLSGKLTYRRQHASLRNEPLARALGLNHRTNPTIVDATAGLGRDSFILASLGFEILLIERSPVIYALLKDGIKRASENIHVAPIVERLHLLQTDAIKWMESCSEKPDLIYLDPMFPERQKSALVKKEMQILQEVIGEDVDAEQLLTVALACATKRVVVKRPRLAQAIPGPDPSFCMKGSSSRFDVYLIKEPHGNLTPTS